MKKSLLLGFILISAMTMPSFAALSTGSAAPSIQPISPLKLKSAPLKTEKIQTAPSLAQTEAKKDLLLSWNSYQPTQGIFFATTELKINLDNFDMEYVLKVQ